MTGFDMELCRYYLIGLDYKQISVLLQLDYSTIWRRTEHLSKSMKGCETHTQMLKALLFG